MLPQNSDQAPKRLCLGKITGAHGVRGLVKILCYGENPQLLQSLGPVFTSENDLDSIKIRLKNAQGRYWLAAIEGVEDRNAAEALGKPELFIEKSKLPVIKEADTYYYADLAGLAVVDENGEKIGTIKAVDNFGAGDLLDIAPVAGKPFYLPFRKEFVVKTDIANGFMVIKDYDRMRLE